MQTIYLAIEVQFISVFIINLSSVRQRQQLTCRNNEGQYFSFHLDNPLTVFVLASSWEVNSC